MILKESNENLYLNERIKPDGYNINEVSDVDVDAEKWMMFDKTQIARIRQILSGTGEAFQGFVEACEKGGLSKHLTFSLLAAVVSVSRTLEEEETDDRLEEQFNQWFSSRPNGSQMIKYARLIEHVVNKEKEFKKIDKF